METRPTVMGAGSRFTTVPKIKMERSVFDLSHGHKTTFDGGYLVPVMAKEVLPGETWNVRANMFCRLNTPIKPIMDNMFLESFAFFVPNRLLWTHWEKFCGAQDNPGDSISFTVPQVQMPAAGPGVGTLWDYMGIPSGAQITGTFYVNALHSRAYAKIWNSWFRDENLQNSITDDTGDGPDTRANYVLMKRGKRFDYLTSCLPWAQKGTAVSLPLGTSALVKAGPYGGSTQPNQLRDPGTGNLINGALGTNTGLLTVGGGVNYGVLDPNGSMYVDMTTVTAATINALRLAEQTQVLLERDARGGTRYTEILRSHFGVESPDARLQRPEYLGGGSTPINIHPVPMTNASSGGASGTQQGNLAGFGTASASGHGFNKSFTEHGVLLFMVNVRADLTYQSGLDRMWSRQTRYDYYWPALSHIGEQAVLNQEIYLVGNGATGDTLAFGYQERYGEYRFAKSLITGKFNSHYATPLDVWHLAQKFAGLPTLGDTFIKDSPPIDRVVAVTSEPQFMIDVFFNIKKASPMPVYGIPGLGGRF